VDDFRALGGVADNVAQGRWPPGHGLFPTDPAKPFLLSVPDNLLFRIRDVEFVNDRMRIKPDSGAAPAERDFFERYQAAFSSGGGGREEWTRLIDMFDSLQPELRNRLVADFGMKPIVEGERRDRILRCFLRSRAIQRRRENHLAPFFDLMNRGGNGLHAKSGPQGEVQLEGRAEGEILLAFDHHDSLGIFNAYGIAAPRAHAFSLPLRTKAGPFELVIGRDPTINTQRWDFPAPQMRVESGTIHLSYLTVGNASSPRMPRGIFHALMREARVGRAEETFDRILFINRTKFLKLLAELDAGRGELVSRLHRMALFQLASLAECVGAREL